MPILRVKEVCQRVGLSTVTIWRLEKEGKFPKRIKLGKRCVGWRDEAIAEWEDTRPLVDQGNSNLNT